jgi:hypothetical protein
MQRFDFMGVSIGWIEHPAGEKSIEIDLVND